MNECDLILITLAVLAVVTLGIWIVWDKIVYKVETLCEKTMNKHLEDKPHLERYQVEGVAILALINQEKRKKKKVVRRKKMNVPGWNI